MDGSFNQLIAASLAFVGGHFFLSSKAVRRAISPAYLPPRAYRAFYAFLVFVAFLWMVHSYYDAPFDSLWFPPSWLAWVPLLVMPIACILVVSGLSTPSPTAVGGEQLLTDEASRPPSGIITITRHPFLWGTALWAASHLCVRGEVASLILMGAILILSLGGMWHIDKRREADLGAAWGPVKLTTSVIPFAAVATGRTTVDWRGISWWRPAIGLVLFLVLIVVHQRIIGFDPMPHF